MIKIFSKTKLEKPRGHCIWQKKNKNFFGNG